MEIKESIMKQINVDGSNVHGENVKIVRVENIVWLVMGRMIVVEVHAEFVMQVVLPPAGL